MEEIVEELPEDADLTTDPGHSQDFIFPTTPTPETNSTHHNISPGATAYRETSPTSLDTASTVEPKPPTVYTSDLGPKPVVLAQGANAIPAATTQENVEERGTGDDRSSLSSGVSSTPRSGPEEDQGIKGTEDGLAPPTRNYATLSRVRKFKVDGQAMQSTTKKIVDVTSNKTLRDNKKYQGMR